MRTLKIFKTLFASILLTLFLVASVLEADERSDQVDALFQVWNSDDSAGAAVSVVQDGELLYASGYGMANLEHGIANTKSSVFHVASVSKQFTAFAIFLLEDDGHLSLDDDIRTHIPELADFGHTITLDHLIHHTSGLRDQWELLVLAGWRMDDVITHNDILELLFAQRELNFAPGEEYLYCNSGYTLLAEVVRRVSGKSLKEFCQERIFSPLRMRDTHFHDDHGHIVSNRTDCYRRRDDGWQKAVLSYAVVGATSLFTTAEDIAKWQTNFETQQVGSEAVFERVFERGQLNNGDDLIYAGGVYYGKLGDFDTIGHSGGDAAYRCHVVRIPERKLSVSVLANTDNVPTQPLANRIATLYLAAINLIDDATLSAPLIDAHGFPIEVHTDCAATVGWARHDGKSQDAKGSCDANIVVRAEGVRQTANEDFVGRYLSPELDASFDFELNSDGDLTLRRRKFGRQLCRPIADGQFRVSSGLEFTIAFPRDPKTGETTHLLLSSGRIKNLRFDLVLMANRE